MNWPQIAIVVTAIAMAFPSSSIAWEHECREEAMDVFDLVMFSQEDGATRAYVSKQMMKERPYILRFDANEWNSFMSAVDAALSAPKVPKEQRFDFAMDKAEIWKEACISDDVSIDVIDLLSSGW